MFYLLVKSEYFMNILIEDITIFLSYLSDLKQAPNYQHRISPIGKTIGSITKMF